MEEGSEQAWVARGGVYAYEGGRESAHHLLTTYSWRRQTKYALCLTPCISNNTILEITSGKYGGGGSGPARHNMWCGVVWRACTVCVVHVEGTWGTYCVCGTCGGHIGYVWRALRVRVEGNRAYVVRVVHVEGIWVTHVAALFVVRMLCTCVVCRPAHLWYGGLYMCGTQAWICVVRRLAYTNLPVHVQMEAHACIWNHPRAYGVVDPSSHRLHMATACIWTHPHAYGVMGLPAISPAYCTRMHMDSPPCIWTYQLTCIWMHLHTRNSCSCCHERLPGDTSLPTLAPVPCPSPPFICPPCTRLTPRPCPLPPSSCPSPPLPPPQLLNLLLAPEP